MHSTNYVKQLTELPRDKYKLTRLKLSTYTSQKGIDKIDKILSGDAGNLSN